MERDRAGLICYLVLGRSEMSGWDRGCGVGKSDFGGTDVAISGCARLCIDRADKRGGGGGLLLR